MPQEKPNENQIEQVEHDYSLGMKKVIVYGWTGTQAVALAVSSDGTVQTA